MLMYFYDLCVCGPAIPHATGTKCPHKDSKYQ